MGKDGAWKVQRKTLPVAEELADRNLVQTLASLAGAKGIASLHDAQGHHEVENHFSHFTSQTTLHCLHCFSHCSLETLVISRS